MREGSEPFRLRKLWPHENDFSSWLSRPENLSLLSAAIGQELTTEGVQVPVKSLSADLVCRFEKEGETWRAVVESQFTLSDHDHLSKLQTYAANLDRSRLLIWIAPEFRREHLDTIEVLNDRYGPWRLIPVALHIEERGGAPVVRLMITDTVAGTGVRRGASRQRIPQGDRRITDYDDPERIAFIIRFIAHLFSRGSPVALKGMLWPSTPGEKPPFAQRNIGPGGVKLKAKISRRDPESLEVELLFLRRAETFPYQKYIEAFTKEVRRLRESIPELAQLSGPTERKHVQFILKKQFGRNVLSQSMEGQVFEWLGKHMEIFLSAFEPIIERLYRDYAKKISD